MLSQNKGKVPKIKKPILQLRDTGWGSEFTSFLNEVNSELNESSESLNLIDRYRRKLSETVVEQSSDVELRFVQHVTLDLLAQEHTLSIEGETLSLLNSEYAEDTASSVRRGHLVGRNAQLAEKSVKAFVAQMERRRLKSDSKEWVSIVSLMRDGKDLADKLRVALSCSSVDNQIETLHDCIAPYIQIVKKNERCKYTGLKLQDIWRYFRLTWANEYKSVPGRSMNVLIRDSAAPYHPIIGIASLGSSVVQHGLRDGWIGWSGIYKDDKWASAKDKELTEFGLKLKDSPVETISWLRNSLDRLIDEIYLEDLINESVIDDEIIREPTEIVINKLRSKAAQFIELHRLDPKRALSKKTDLSEMEVEYWKKQAETYLFKSKRSKLLADLLSIKCNFHFIESLTVNSKSLSSSDSKNARRTVGKLLRILKSEHVGVNMMDITVCGAVAPYNHILGGKLVCMLLCSTEITDAYRRKYENMPSVIASSMQGKAVVRDPNLVLLCTTSLYGRSLSQYSRVRIPGAEIDACTQGTIRYYNIGKSEGFGTFHFSKHTIDLAKLVVERSGGGSQVNYVFGEGVSPLLRKLRQGFERVGFKSEVLLLHGNQRVTYGVPLAENFREILLGAETKARYILSTKDESRTTEKIADYWRRRWLLKRASRAEVLELVSEHTNTYPVKHGAAVEKIEPIKASVLPYDFE